MSPRDLSLDPVSNSLNTQTISYHAQAFLHEFWGSNSDLRISKRALYCLKPSPQCSPSKHLSHRRGYLPQSSHLHKAHLQASKLEHIFGGCPPHSRDMNTVSPQSDNSTSWKEDPGLSWIESYLSHCRHPSWGEIMEISLLLISKVCLRWINALSWTSTLDKEQGQSLSTYNIKPTVFRLLLTLPPVLTHCLILYCVSSIRKAHFAFCNLVYFPHDCSIHWVWISSLLSNL